MADQIDRYFGRLVLDQRLATTQQIELCISEQTRRTAQGRPTSLSELTGERGILSARQIKGLLAQMNLRVLDCGACGQTHTLVGPRADKQLECKGCGNLLTDSAPAVTADIASQSDRDATMTDTPHPDAGAGMHDKTLPPDSTRLGPMTLDSQPPTQISPFRGKDPARPLNEDPLIGRHLSGKYEIIEHIGRGGMGAVYRARHTKLDRLCAVKVLPRELSDRPDLLQRFRREAQATARLAQKQVVTIFDVDTDGPTEYLAMEFIEGQTLEKLVQQKGKFRVKTSLQIIRQAAVGLAAAHREGIIHRDIKPANLMLTNDGMIKVMDFGLAQLVEITSLISEQGQICTEALMDNR